MSNYTKGEWKLIDGFNIEDSKGLSIATVYWNNEPHHTTMVQKKEGVDNAKLITAAPKLAEAIQYYFDVLDEVRGEDWDKRPDHVLQKMLAAMSEAGCR
jgi:hypothetical protein